MHFLLAFLKLRSSFTIDFLMNWLSAESQSQQSGCERLLVFISFNKMIIINISLHIFSLLLHSFYFWSQLCVSDKVKSTNYSKNALTFYNYHTTIIYILPVFYQWQPVANPDLRRNPSPNPLQLYFPVHESHPIKRSSPLHSTLILRQFAQWFNSHLPPSHPLPVRLPVVIETYRGCDSLTDGWLCLDMRFCTALQVVEKYLR